MPQYCYSPLSQKPNAIRLLRLLPSKDESAYLRCELFEYTLRLQDTAYHPYEALSYVWGDEKKPRSIIIIDHQNDDQELAVTQNLYIAFLHLRDHEIPRIIWADAVCINQEEDKEKEYQIRLMPAIYTKASRVIVWLGEAQDDSDQAFESIRIAAEKPAHPSNTQLFEQAIQQLLKRPWFNRIWVLQETAAARHILIMCGSAVIDGHAFCLGLDVLQNTLEDSMCQVTYLIRRTIFRSRYMSKEQDKLSLGICSLGELVDMYHAHEATKRHDKVYALLGMSSDDLSKAGLEPNYNIPWNMLMRNLIKFLLGDYASVGSWDDREIAVIKCKGHVLGQVSSVKIRQDNRRDIQITLVLGNPEHSKNHEIPWSLPSSAKPIKEGDVICLLQGAQKPTIVRACEDYFAVSMIAATPLEHIRTERSDLLKSEESFTRDFLFVWDWENSLENLQISGKYDTFIGKLPKIGLEGQLNSATRIWNLAQILGDAGQYEEARKKGRQAIEVCKKTLGAEHLRTIESQYSLIPLLLAAILGYNEVVALLVVKDRVDLDSRDWSGQTPLSWAARSGHEAVVKLLLETGKVDVESEDKWSGRTPLSWASQNGHEAVVKLLLETGKANVESKDNYGQTPLSWAAQNGQEAIVKLLLEIGKVDVESKDNYGQTPLSWAAQNGHEAIVKLLLETGKANVKSKDNSGQTPLSWASQKGHEAVVKVLLETGKADVESKNNSGKTALSSAAWNGNEAMVKLLLETGKADIESKDNIFGRTPLSWAAQNGHEAVVKLLLETGKVDIESKDNSGRTPLVSAFVNGPEAAVVKLLQSFKVSSL